MERTEPALIPEWLRCSGSVTGGVSSANHLKSSSDVPSSTRSMRNRAFRSIGDKDSPHYSFLDRSSYSNSRCSSSSNGSTKHPYSSFIRSHRDKNHDKEKERSAIRNISDPLASILSNRVDNTLRRSQSMVSRKPGEASSQRAAEFKNSGSLKQSSGIGMLSGGSVVRGMQKAAFEMDFPSLGTEEKQGVADIGRVSFPGLSTTVQSLPIGNSGLLGGEGWTSALAEVPTIIGSSIKGTTSIQQTVVATPSSGASSSMVGLNMAESLSRVPSCVCTMSQLPDKTQRLEELAVKQSRQLIPMTPSTSKPLVFSSSDKLKQPKTAVRASESILPAKRAQQQPYTSQSASQYPRVGHVGSDAPKTSHSGKFLVLKPVWENGVSSMAKDVSSTTNNSGSRVANSQAPVAASVPAAPLSDPNHPNLSTVERKAAVLAYNPRSTAEKKASMAQIQSRIDFFNLVRKKTSANSSTIVSDSSPASLSPTMKNFGGEVKEVGNDPASPLVAENGNKKTSNGDRHEEAHNLCLNRAVYPDEEEAAFLRSLGWEENTGEDEGLTEEEINAFYQEYMKLRPSLKLCRGAQPKNSVFSESCVSNSRGGLSGSNSSKALYFLTRIWEIQFFLFHGFCSFLTPYVFWRNADTCCMKEDDG